MKHSTASPGAIRARAAELGEARAMRRGSLTERWVRCSKPGCACKENHEARHGPYYSLTKVVGGVTRTRLVKAEQAEVVRRQIEAGREYRDAAEVYWQACEQAADAELEAVTKDSAAAGEKRGSGKPSQRRSSPKSRR